jgi:predicted DNA-binding transcriptional regulator AlpA
MSSTLKKGGSTAPAVAAPDPLCDFDYVATHVFHPKYRFTKEGESQTRPGITRNGLNLMIQRGDFPQPIRLGAGPKAPIRWRLSDLRRWQCGLLPRKAA